MVPKAIRTRESKVTDFWEGKAPCWEMMGCPEDVRRACPALRNRRLPCWQIAGTYAKLDDFGADGSDTEICAACPVFKRWGDNSCRKIVLFGQGIDTGLRSIEALADMPSQAV